VHWPIIVFFKFKKIYQITFWDQAIIALASLIISIIIYFFIEQPLRIGQFKKPHFSPKQFVVTGVSFALILLITGYYLRNGTIRGNNYLFDEGKVAYHASKLVNNEICNLKNYSLISEKTVSAACNDQARYQILTIGNSHEKHGYKLIKNLYLSEFKQDKLNIVFSSTDLGYGEFRGCSFSLLERLPLKSINPDCEWLANKLNDYQGIGSQFDAVIVSAFMPSLLGKIYMDYAYELQKVNPDLKIVVIGSVVSLSQYRCADLINSTKNPKACNDNRLIGYYNPNEEQEIKEKWPHLNFFYLDQRFLLCGNRGYEQCEITVNVIPIFFDQHHFNDIAIPELISRIKEAKIDERLSTYLSLSTG
jgi:hypothetical protein